MVSCFQQHRVVAKSCSRSRAGSIGSSGVAEMASSSDVVLDPLDAGIEAAIVRLERKSFIKDCLIPEIQCLLRLPAAQAKHAYLAALSQFSLVTMLILAALLGTALNPLNPENYPGIAPALIATYNMFSMIICLACMFGTCLFLLEGVQMEGTPEERVHSIIANSDPFFHYGTCMVAVALHGTGLLVVIRAWISGFDTIQCIVFTAIAFLMYLKLSYVWFKHLQTCWPVVAQRWAKLYFPIAYKKEASQAAIDDLVAELRYLQLPRDQMITVSQLSGCLERYFASCTITATSDTNNSSITDSPNLASFLRLLESEVGGRLAPMAKKLARKAFDKALEAKLEKFADDAVTQMK